MQKNNITRPRLQLNIPKTPENLFFKHAQGEYATKKDNQHLDKPSVKKVKYMDELYTKKQLDEYFS